MDPKYGRAEKILIEYRVIRLFTCPFIIHDSWRYDTPSYRWKGPAKRVVSSDYIKPCIKTLLYSILYLPF